MLRTITILAAVYVALVIWWPETSSTYVCNGELIKSDGTGANPKQYSAKVVRYQPWILWAVNKGDVITENALGFFDFRPATFTSLEAYFDSDGEHRSYFSLVSHRIVIYFKDSREFRGRCELT
ncbi:hypothetical protein OIV19_03385 [Brucella sp. HL-2]|nr:hypothetical protein [Brucella sp. HL-2]MCV9906658.1 hypothetical protein [Brucella sp. HL-2]